MSIRSDGRVQDVDGSGDGRRFFARLRMTRRGVLGGAIGLALGVASAADAAQGTMVIEHQQSVRDFDRFIYCLADSALCDTTVTADSRGIVHRVYCDSGWVFHQQTLFPSPLPSPQRGEGRDGESPQTGEGKDGSPKEEGRDGDSPQTGAEGGTGAEVRWSARIRLSRTGGCSSPLVFERSGDGGEPLLVVMWREEYAGRTEVVCRFHHPQTMPFEWGVPLCVTLRP